MKYILANFIDGHVSEEFLQKVFKSEHSVMKFVQWLMK